MKTLQDCKDRVARREGFNSFEDLEYYPLKHKLKNMPTRAYLFLSRAAQLYGRYMRFVGRSQLREEEKLKRASAKDSRLLNMYEAKAKEEARHKNKENA